MRLTSTGLGIGTSSPSSALQVNGNFRISNGSAFTASNSLIRKIEAMSGSANQFASSSIDFYTATFTDNGQIALTTGGSERMRIDGAGNVGIGTSSPAGKLQVASSTTNTTLKLSNSTTGSASGDGLDIIADGTDGYVWNRENGPLLFGTNNTERLRIDSSGNVGIGTTSPDANLTVNGAASFAAGTALLPSIARAGDLNTGFWFPAADTIAASTAGSERLRIDSSGNLLVGTTTAFGGVTINKTTSILAASVNLRQTSRVQASSAVNNSTVDALRFLDVSSAAFGNSAVVGHIHLYVRGGSGANAFSAVYAVAATGNGLSDSVFTLVTSVTRGTSPVSSVALLDDGILGAIKFQVTYINNSGVVDGGEANAVFVGMTLD
jgi:hypothetical protein